MAAARSAMRSTRAPSRPNSQNSARAATRMSCFVSAGLRCRGDGFARRRGGCPGRASAERNALSAMPLPLRDAHAKVLAAIPPASHRQPARLTSNHPVTYGTIACALPRPEIDMATHRLGIIMHGVTGRMGTNQHLIRSILAIRADGGAETPQRRHCHSRPDTRRQECRQAANAGTAAQGRALEHGSQCCTRRSRG